MRTSPYLKVLGLLAIASIAGLVAAGCDGNDPNPCSDPTAPGCGEDGPLELTAEVIQSLCVQPTITETSDLQTLAVSALSDTDCYSGDLGQEGGYFETWHLYPNRTETVTFTAQSQFDNLLMLVEVLSATTDRVNVRVIAQSDDSGASTTNASITALLRAGTNYFLRVYGFNEDETGQYTITVTRPAQAPPPPSTGSLRVNVTTSGPAQPTYTVTLNDQKAKSVSANGSVTYSNIVTGDYDVELSGLGTCVVNDDNPQTVTVTANQTVSANFSVTCVQVQLTVSGSGAGSGTITDGGNINCSWDGSTNSGTCSDVFPAGTNVTLTATPDAGSAFVAWSGACSGTGQCQLSMNQNESLTAAFDIGAYQLTVFGSGPGSGTITDGGNINCSWGGQSNTGTCSDVFTAGTTVTLTATGDAASSTFNGWSGACAGGNPCQITLNQSESASAAFILNTYQLQVSGSGNGSGTITSNIGGINCSWNGTTTSGTCSQTYDHGTVVTLTANPSAGSGFTGWSDACTGGGSCQVTMDQGRNATASFALDMYLLTVSGTGTGTGTITDGGRINCTWDGAIHSGNCVDSFAVGTTVTLTATNDAASSSFDGWSGACTGDNPCQITITQAESATARFTLLPRQLTVTGSGTGTGTITSDVGGINCTWNGTTQTGVCSQTYNHGTVVNLTATGGASSGFTGWSGSCTGLGPCQVTMDQDRSSTASFVLNLYQVTVAGSGNGSGTITDGGNINCSWDGATTSGICSDSYPAGTQVTLTATNDAATSDFGGWTGACTGGNPCLITVNQPEAATANFTLTPRQLTVFASGTGSGTITSDVGGINCTWNGSAQSGVCSQTYDHGTVVTLTATSVAGSGFSGWSGACTGGGPCVVTMDQGQSVVGSFALDMYLLTVSGGGNGNGTITDGGNINCNWNGSTTSGTCSDVFSSGTQVTLTATNDAGTSQFTGWSGACTGGNPCVVTMSQAQSATAGFVLNTYQLQVFGSGTGSGTITSNVGGINCTWNGTSQSGTCSQNYNHGTVVTLTASPAASSGFSNWSGSCTGGGQCVVTMDQVRSATGSFVLNTYQLTVSGSGNGSGTISDGGNINCTWNGSTTTGICADIFPAGTQVTLIATNSGATSEFTGWSGSCTGGNPCVITINQTESATANFVLLPRQLTVIGSGTGSGTITSDVGGINCTWNGTSQSGVCSQTYDHGTVVNLTATPGASATFSGWSGSCSGTGACQVTMDQNRSSVASFALITFQLTVSGSGTGSGTITDGGSINCSWNGTTNSGVCSDIFTAGTQVTLIAADDGATSDFGGWSGACTGGNPCVITMNQTTAATANFVLATRQLSVIGGGTGSGTITSDVGGINCTWNGTSQSGVCSQTYNHGTVVNLTATPGASATFSGWSGSCTGTGACQVTMDQGRSVVASFAIDMLLLTVSGSGNGSGTITDGGNINCTWNGSTNSGTCSDIFPAGTQVTLTGTNDGITSEFTGWSGACTGANPCVITMNQPTSATANFVLAQRQLTVLGLGTGSGTITSNVGGINCTWNGTTQTGVCSQTFDHGTVVTLTATAEASSSFTAWSGACTGGNPCQVTMDQTRSATASFAINTWQLQTLGAGAGNGTITSNVGGINCTWNGTSQSGTCAQTYNHGTVVTLTAAPGVGATFTGWSGACTGTGQCVVTMDQAPSAPGPEAARSHRMWAASTAPGTVPARAEPAHRPTTTVPS
jgi:hypothetical protein